MTMSLRVSRGELILDIQKVVKFLVLFPENINNIIDTIKIDKV